MSFDTTISIADIISIAAILLTLVTILQVKHQRSDALNPYITITPHEKVYRYSNKNGGLNEDAEILLSNVGNDLSKNITIELSLCDIPVDLLSETIKITKNTCLINKQTLLVLQQNIELTYCESKEKKNISSCLRNYVIILSHIYTDIVSSGIFEKYQNAAKVAIKTSYHNILGEKFNKHFVLQLDPLTISAEEILFFIKTNELSKKQYLKLIGK